MFTSSTLIAPRTANTKCGVQLFEDRVRIVFRNDSHWNSWQYQLFGHFLAQIVGGNVTSIYDYPWTALLRYRNEQKQLESWGCSGSYIGWIKKFNKHLDKHTLYFWLKSNRRSNDCHGSTLCGWTIKTGSWGNIIRPIGGIWHRNEPRLYWLWRRQGL